MSMKFLAMAATLWAAAGAGMAETLPGAPFMALGDGGVYARGTFPRDVEWTGLFCAGSECELRNADVMIGDGSAINILDESEATEVVHAAGRPIAVFAGLPIPMAPVQTWYLPAVEKGEWKGPIKTAGHWDMPWGARPLRWQWQARQAEYHHSVATGDAQQALLTTSAEGHYGSDTSLPEVHWVGDLNGDGLIDVLLSLPDDNCGFDQRLYVSGGAVGSLLQLAAQLVGREPACGC